MAISDNRIVRLLRDEAIRYDDWATKKYWLHLFKSHVFPESDFVMTTEQPPSPTGAQSRIDLTVENFGDRRFFLQLVVVEARENGRATTTRRDIADVEARLYSASHEHYAGNPARARMWAMSVLGPCARIWAFDAQRASLAPVLPVGNDLEGEAS